MNPQWPKNLVDFKMFMKVFVPKPCEIIITLAGLYKVLSHNLCFDSNLYGNFENYMATLSILTYSSYIFAKECKSL